MTSKDASTRIAIAISTYDEIIRKPNLVLDRGQKILNSPESFEDAVGQMEGHIARYIDKYPDLSIQKIFGHHIPEAVEVLKQHHGLTYAADQ